MVKDRYWLRLNVWERYSEGQVTDRDPRRSSNHRGGITVWYGTLDNTCPRLRAESSRCFSRITVSSRENHSFVGANHGFDHGFLVGRRTLLLCLRLGCFPAATDEPEQRTRRGPSGIRVREALTCVFAWGESRDR
jgi:hypothetical protein